MIDCALNVSILVPIFFQGQCHNFLHGQCEFGKLSNRCGCDKLAEVGIDEFYVSTGLDIAIYRMALVLENNERFI